MVVGYLQKICMYEYLATVLGEQIPPYVKYNPALKPGLENVFSAAAFRFGHSSISAIIPRSVSSGFHDLLLRNVSIRFLHPLPNVYSYLS